MPTKCSSLVHTEETTVPSASIGTYGERLRQSCQAEWDAADAIYSYIDKLNNSSKHFNLDNCRSQAWFVRHIETGQVRIAANSCHLRWCPICSDSKRSHISRSVTTWVEEQSHPKFLTLTIMHSNAPLTHQIDHLYQYFRLLRKRKEFREAVPGGFWFFQIKKSKSSRQWHPHLHCLITGKYIPHSKLVHIWKDITCNSTVVDIRSIRDPAKASNDAARYAACPGSLAGLSFADALELVECMHGRRICGTWGTARTVSLRAPTCPDREKWETVGGWFSVLGLRTTSDRAKAILAAWQNQEPLEAGIKICHKGPAFEVFDIDEMREYESEFDYPSERSPPSTVYSKTQ